MKFKRKNTEVTAVQFVDGRYGEAIDFCPTLHVNFEWVQDSEKEHPPERIVAGANVDDKPIGNGDWIVKDDTGQCVVLTDEEFKSEYEAA